MGYEELIRTLKQLGLSNNEARVYLTLLDLGTATVGKIAKRAMIDRSFCYDILKRLLENGLVSYAIEAKHKLFKPANPLRLLEILREKEEETKKIIPKLSLMYKQQKEQSNVTLYKGYKGLKTVFDGILRKAKNKENLVLDSSGLFVKKMPYYAPHFVKGLEKNNIKVRHIVRMYKNIHPSKTTKIKLFPKEIKQTIITTNIYDAEIAIILWTEPPEAIIIKNKDAAESYKSYFELLWKHTRHTRKKLKH